MTATLTTVDITSLAAGGDGVGRADGMVLFVPRTAPGDRANVRVLPGKRFGRGTLVELERASPDRVDPPCGHYVADRCGGCQVQHISYEAQLAAKCTIIGDAVRRIGHRDAADPVVMPSDAQWRYRRKLTLHLRWTGSSWIAGLHPFDDPVAVFDLEDCPITDERVVAIWRALRPLFTLLPRERSLRASVRVLGDVVSMTVEGGSRWTTSDDFFKRATALSELWWKPEHGRHRRLASRASGTGDGAFVQVNARVAASLREHVLQRVRAHGGERIVDAYAGSGATALPLAEDGRTVVAIESDRTAVEFMAGRLLSPSRAIMGRVEDHIADELPADVVLLNPPRAGVDARVTSALEGTRRPPGLLIYVSCDPATLARDLARMPRYRLADMRAWDMFPQTAHVETVCELVPEAA